MNTLFSPIKIRGIEFKNRIAVSPMCQYSAANGKPSDWHLVHLGCRAIGGAGLIIQEATAISPEGRITPDDLGIWNDIQAGRYEVITDFIKEQDCIPGIQLAHAGRKASTYAPWKGEGAIKPENGGWSVLAPSPIPFSDSYLTPSEMTKHDIWGVIKDFCYAAKRSVEAGYRVIELHMAHGYLLHQFLSPLSNKRDDEYGGSFENRCRLALEIISDVRMVIPDYVALFVRISCTDWIEGGWCLEESVEFANLMKEAGVDLIDCSGGGNIPDAKIPVAPGYQVIFAEKIKSETGILTGAVGLITEAEKANGIISRGSADIVLLGRAMLRNPSWAIDAAKKLGVKIEIPNQYKRAY